MIGIPYGVPAFVPLTVLTADRNVAVLWWYENQREVQKVRERHGIPVGKGTTKKTR